MFCISLAYDSLGKGKLKECLPYIDFLSLLFTYFNHLWRLLFIALQQICYTTSPKTCTTLRSVDWSESFNLSTNQQQPTKVARSSNIKVWSRRYHRHCCKYLIWLITIEILILYIHTPIGEAWNIFFNIDWSIARLYLSKYINSSGTGSLA